jgi:hypothetical protein
MKTELKWIAFCVLWIVLLGWVLPWLISAPSTIAVIVGFLIILVFGYGTYRFIRNELETPK